MPSGHFPPELRPALGHLETERLWRTVARRVRSRANLMLGRRATRTEIDELCNEAVCRLVEERHEPDLELLLGRAYVIVKSLVRNHFRRHRNRWLEMRSDVDVANDERADDDDDRNELALDRLRQRLESDPLAQKIFDQMRLGEDRPRFLAAALDTSIAEINAAKRRLWRQAGVVRRRMTGD